MYAKKMNYAERNIVEVKEHIERLHGDSKGFITLASKNNGNYKQWHYKTEDIENNEEEIIESINSYISQNTFYRPQRRIENIKELKALYIDLDVYNTKYTKAVSYTHLDVYKRQELTIEDEELTLVDEALTP